MLYSATTMKTERHGAGVFTLPDFLDAAECAAHIARSERGGFEEAGVRGDDGEYIYKDARNNDRLIVDDAELAATLFERARSCLPAELEQWRHAEFRERWRLSRLNPTGQRFWTGQSGSTVLSDPACSAVVGTLLECPKRGRPTA